MCIRYRIIPNIFISSRNVSTKISSEKKVTNKSIGAPFLISRTFARMIAWCSYV